METALYVNEATCIGCGKCVRVCPSVIFVQEKAGGKACAKNIRNCIACGHCVAVCPTSSVVHADFPPEKVHPVDPALLPTPEQVMLLCKTRRSNRAFSSRPIPSDWLDRILEAAHRAPTASNGQQVEFTLITDPAKLKQISEFTLDVFGSVVRRLENPVVRFLLKPFLSDVYGYLPVFHRLLREHEKGNDQILRGAVAVIFIHTPESSRFGRDDANLAYQNGSLMAESLGVSQFYTGFVCSAIRQEKHNRLARLLGIDGRIHAGMALGIPQFTYPNYIDRKDLKVTRL